MATTDPAAAAVDAGAESPTGLSHRQIQVVFSGLMLGMLLAALDQTIVSTALPTIVGELGGQDRLAWVVTAYLLTSTTSTPLWGKVSDLLGRKILFQAAIVVFLVGSVLIGLSQNMTSLIAFRAVQGIGAGGLMALAQAIIGDIVAPRERGRYQGYIGSVFAVSSVAGPLLGGFFVDQLSWRWAFYINLPIGIVALVVTGSVLNLDFRRIDHRVDYLGAALLVGGVTPLLLLTEWGGREYEWGSPTIIGLGIVGAVVLALFAAQERRAEEPILAPRLFRNGVFNITSAGGFIVGLAMFGAIVFMPQYLQIVKGNSPTRSGLLMIPMMVGLMATSIGSGRIIAQTGKYKKFPIIGLTILPVGLYLLSLLDVESSYVQQGLSVFVVGLGIGMVMQVLVLAVQNAVEQRDLGSATSAATFFRSMGGAFGVAIFGAILNNRLDHNVANELSRVNADPSQLPGKELLGSPSAIHSLPEPFKGAVIQAFSDGLHVVFLCGIPVALLGLLVVLFLKELPLRESAHLGMGSLAEGGEALAPPGAELMPTEEAVDEIESVDPVSTIGSSVASSTAGGAGPVSGATVASPGRDSAGPSGQR